MFFKYKTQSKLRLAQAADVAVEFATLGEYRVVTAVAEVQESVAEDLWAGDVSWSATPRRREAPCRLPRAHDRGSRLVLSA